MTYMTHEYQRHYRSQIKAMTGVRLYVAPPKGYVPPRVRSTYAVRPKRGWSGKIFRMENFSGNKNLRLRLRRYP